MLYYFDLVCVVVSEGQLGPEDLESRGIKGTVIRRFLELLAKNATLSYLIL